MKKKIMKWHEFITIYKIINVTDNTCDKIFQQPALVNEIAFLNNDRK